MGYARKRETGADSRRAELTLWKIINFNTDEWEKEREAGDSTWTDRPGQKGR